MISKFQFDAVSELIDSGVTNYVQIRQHVGLTSEELDDILKNVDYYKSYFAEKERLAKLQELNERKNKKKWWKR